MNEVGNRILFLTVDFAKKIFAQRLISCYALGSLAHGGFAPLVSDVDIAPVDITQIIDNVKSTNLLLANRLSIFGVHHSA